MSRIAGIVRRTGTTADRERVDAMLAAMRGEVPTVADACVLGRAALGVTTWTAPNIELAGDVVCVVDSPLWSAADVVARFRQHGFVDALAQIDGDFAIALFDQRTSTLWLARDRFGIKPLYYSLRPDRIAFGSRPRALLALPDVSKTPNQGFVARFAGLHYRTFDNLPRESPYA
ncbi:MAG: asparagine synthase, partial [Deltaproteobacteria bacterium]|nr:asparagine synthase [Deltaproteobacteria bacterium]